MLQAARAIPSEGHKFAADYTIDRYPTCEGAGEKSRHCTVCGERTDITAIDPNDHTWVAGDVLVPACTGEGRQQYTCSACGANKVEALAPADHTPRTLPAVAPTCLQDGLTEGSVCDVCGKVLKAQDAVKALGHIDADNDGICDRCDEPMGGSPDDGGTTPAPSGGGAGVCAYCGKVHTGFFGFFINFIHSFLAFMGSLFNAL